MMKEIFSICLLLLCCSLNAQKVVKKSIINSDISFIRVDAHNCFKIAIETSETNEMAIEAIIDGEYKKDLLLNMEEEGQTISVSAGFQPNFMKPNDKLSTHKVVSISLKITVPVLKNVEVYGTSCNVTATGNYRNLKITLADGRCKLNKVSETASVYTQSGDILVYAPNAEISANSKYGTVEGEWISSGDSHYMLTTITGDIQLNKTE